MAKKKTPLTDEEFARRYNELIKTKGQNPISKQSFDMAVKKTLIAKKPNGLTSR